VALNPSVSTVLRIETGPRGGETEGHDRETKQRWRGSSNGSDSARHGDFNWRRWLDENHRQLGRVAQVGQPSEEGSWAGMKKSKGKCYGLLESFELN
jgi:hypothetical protein